MDNYYEQNVAGERGAKQQLLYSLCWLGVVLMGMIALFFAVNIIRITEDALSVSWLSVIVTLAAAALAVLAYRFKDNVYKEYDYILWNGELEICAVYNRSRRKKLTTIQLGKLAAWGPADAMARHMHGVKVQNYCVHSDAGWCLVYGSESGKQAALLELTEETCGQIRALGSQVRMAEVKP